MREHLSKLWGLIFLGVLIISTPTLILLPRGYKDVLIVISGSGVVLLSFLLARAIAAHSHPTRSPNESSSR